MTNPKFLNRKLFLKQLAVDLCNSERRILFRAQYVSHESFSSLHQSFSSKFQVPSLNHLNNSSSYHPVGILVAADAKLVSMTKSTFMIKFSFLFLSMQQILRRRLRDIRSGEVRALNLFDGFRKLFK